MTYILGSRCKDGVVLVADRKVTYEDGHVEWQDKLFMDFSAIVFGAAGPIALIDKFRDRLMRYCAEHPYGPIDDYITQIEKSTANLNRTYEYALYGKEFDVLVGLKTNLGAVLQYITPVGLAEHVKEYKPIGNGEPYGSLLLKILWRKDMTMQDVAELGYLIIKYIEKLHLNDMVGVGDGKPQVWFVPDEPKQNPFQAANELLEKFEQHAESRLEALKENIQGVFKS